MEAKKPHYFKEGAYKVNLELDRMDKDFKSPNRNYAFDYKSYLELNNRKEKTIARRIPQGLPWGCSFKAFKLPIVSMFRRNQSKAFERDIMLK